MHTSYFLAEIVLLLAAAVCLVPFFTRLKLSPILGYLVAGIVVGPYALDLIRSQEAVQALSELGIIFLMFMIGLELSFSRLLRTRGKVLLLGAGQVVVTSLVIGAACFALGLSLPTVIIVSGGLALSSTAIVMQLIEESSEKLTLTGRLSLATLILQDLAVVPLLVAVPLLATGGNIASAMSEASIKAVIGILVIIVLGRLLLRPLFKHIASRSHHELFTAMALLVVLGLAHLSSVAGLSPALGAFVGGLLVAETEFKPQVEADILPFKGMFLGMFFITVGMMIDLPTIRDNAALVIVLASLLMLIKSLIIFSLAKALRFPSGHATHTALLLCQGGEFAFVLFSLAADYHVISDMQHQLLYAVVAVSMALTPLLHLGGTVLRKRLERGTETSARDLLPRDLEIGHHVVVVGYGRVGRVVVEVLEAENVPYVVLDIDAANVTKARAEGVRVYFGDASRAVVLKAAGLPRASAMIVTHNEMKAAEQTIAAVRKLVPSLPLLVRSKTFEDAQRLESVGATLAVAEMMESSLQLSGALLRELGTADGEVSRILESFRAQSYVRMR